MVWFLCFLRLFAAKWFLGFGFGGGLRAFGGGELFLGGMSLALGSVLCG